jgi:hypothetical protein
MANCFPGIGFAGFLPSKNPVEYNYNYSKEEKKAIKG